MSTWWWVFSWKSSSTSRTSDVSALTSLMFLDSSCSSLSCCVLEVSHVLTSMVSSSPGSREIELISSPNPYPLGTHSWR